MCGKGHKVTDLKPDIQVHHYILINAFNRMSQERRMENNAPMPITENAIYEYIERNSIGDRPVDLFVYAIHQIDNKYIEMRCDEIRRKQSK